MRILSPLGTEIRTDHGLATIPLPVARCLAVGGKPLGRRQPGQDDGGETEKHRRTVQGANRPRHATVNLDTAG